MTTQYSELVALKTYVPAQGSKVMVGTPFALGATVPTKTVTLGATPTAVGDTTVAVVATTFDLYEGTRLFFEAGKVLYVTEKTATGATSIKVEAAKAIIAAGDIATLYSWLPVYGLKTFSYDNAKTEISDQTYSDGLVEKQSLVGLKYSASGSGPFVPSDPGMEEILTAEPVGDFLTYTFIYPGQYGGFSFQANTSVSENNDRGAFITRSISMTITGAIDRFSE